MVAAETAARTASRYPALDSAPSRERLRTTHFDGLNHFDQRFAGTGDYANTQFSLEPPDQALCVGNGFVVESVNTAIRVRNTAGAALTAPLPLNQFFGLAPESIRSDAASSATSPATRSATSTPTPAAGSSPSSRSTSIRRPAPSPAREAAARRQHRPATRPAPQHLQLRHHQRRHQRHARPSGCPCLGDQPLIGADANGFYVTTNEFPILEDGFNGAQVYAMCKWRSPAGPPADRGRA